MALDARSHLLSLHSSSVMWVAVVFPVFNSGNQGIEVAVSCLGSHSKEM